MSSYGGRGPMINGVLWSQCLVAGIFVLSRCYTRHFILRSSGLDDLCLLLTLILLIAYSALVTVGTTYGIGQKQANVASAADYTEAMKYEVVGQGVCIFNLVTAKAAVGFLLLRFADRRWHRWAVWFCVGTNAIVASLCTVAVFVQCLPVQKTWDRTVPGSCWLDFTTIGIFTSAYAVAVDFVLATIPIFIVWDLNMKRKDKIITVVSLGLGILAGACGIVRTMALRTLSSFDEYIYDTVPMLIYSATENFVFALCASVPVLRPLYVKVIRGQLSGEGGSSGKASGRGGDSSYKMGAVGSGSGGDAERSLGRDVGGSGKGRGPNTRLYAELVETGNHGSEEEILAAGNLQPVGGSGGGDGGGGGGGGGVGGPPGRRDNVSGKYSGDGAPQSSYFTP